MESRNPNDMESKNSKFVKDSAVISYKIAMPEDSNPTRPGNVANVNGGSILHLIDNIGGIAALRHTNTQTVTISIDSMEFIYPVKVGDLIIAYASVNRVFGTSLEVGVKIEVENVFTGDRNTTARAYLTFVTINDQGKPIKVPYKIVPQTEDEKRRFKEADIRRKLRLSNREEIKSLGY